MAPAEEPPNTEQLTALLREIRERVRARYPQPEQGAAAPVPLADLMPLVHARDAAEAKVAAIGTVNPRRGGPLNALVQGLKRLVARALDWHVREQVVFNREMVACVNAAMEALNEVNRAFVEIANRHHNDIEALRSALGRVETEARLLQDIRSHWAEWRVDWERKLSQNEIQFLRAVADLQGAFQHRATLMEGNYRDLLMAQHANFTGALERSGHEIQQRLWADLERIRVEYERLIHVELRVIRQRAAGTAAELPAAPAPPPEQPAFDYARFAERFRGTEEDVKARQRLYLPYFAGCQSVLDVGCGRGEFLEDLREAGVPARGIDLSAESVRYCRAKGLAAETADLFEYLAALPSESLDGIFCAQVVEHVPPARLPELIRLAAACLARGGVIALETPNPECLAIFATHFYLDPTHQRPVPQGLLSFYLEEFGIGRLQVKPLFPAIESMPALADLPPAFRDAFFGGLDYCILGKKL